MCKKYYGSGPVSEKKIASSSQLPTTPHAESKGTWTQGHDIGSEESVKLETMTSSTITPFQAATMAPNLCTELEVRASILVGSEPM